MVVSNVFYFPTEPVGNNPIWRSHIFLLDWFNHQLAGVVYFLPHQLGVVIPTVVTSQLFWNILLCIQWSDEWKSPFWCWEIHFGGPGNRWIDAQTCLWGSSAGGGHGGCSWCFDVQIREGMCWWFFVVAFLGEKSGGVVYISFIESHMSKLRFFGMSLGGLKVHGYQQVLCLKLERFRLYVEDDPSS